MSPWRPTHAVHSDYGVTLTYLCDGSLYTREEWDDGAASDWTLDDDGLLFQGRVMDGAYWTRVGPPAG